MSTKCKFHRLALCLTRKLCSSGCKVLALPSRPAQGTAARGQTEARRSGRPTGPPGTHSPGPGHLLPHGGREVGGLPRCETGSGPHPGVHTEVGAVGWGPCHAPRGNHAKPTALPSWGHPSLSLHQLRTWDKDQMRQPQHPDLQHGRRGHIPPRTRSGVKATLLSLDLTSTKSRSAAVATIRTCLPGSVFTPRLRAQQAEDRPGWGRQAHTVSRSKSVRVQSATTLGTNA